MVDDWQKGVESGKEKVLSDLQRFLSQYISLNYNKLSLK